MTEQRREFGKRKPLTAPPTPPVKRSGHVALLLMGSLAVGGTGYAMMSRPSCTPTSPGMGAPPADGACAQRSSGGGGGGGNGGGTRFYDRGNSGRTSVATAESGSVSRGGFGSFAHAFGFSSSG